MITRTPKILCDHRGLRCFGYFGYIDGERCMTNAEIRADAKERGWTRWRGPDGKYYDLCPGCSKKGVDR